jgi:small subunit ribosomal protein S17
MAGQRSDRKVRTGVVVSDRMDKTVIVRIESQKRHPLYGKTVRRTSRLAAHDEANEAHVGDVVRVMETRPLSKSKRWRVLEIVEKAR